MVRVEKAIKRLDLAAFVAIVLWAWGRAYSLYHFPVSAALLSLPLGLAAASNVLNFRQKPGCRVRAYELAHHTYWHPICGLMIALSVLFMELAYHLPNDTFFKVLGIFGVVMLCVVFIWTFLRWLYSLK